jgi:spore coat polysaccharide biosynthesis protein SpsF
MNTTGIIIQARTGSTRFPNKILKPFGGEKTFLDFLLKRFVNYVFEIPVIVATTKNEKDNSIINIAENYSTIKTFQGDEEDVLNRFIKCSEKFGLEKIIRVCSDNPFISLNSIQSLQQELEQNQDSDYIAYFINNTPSIKTHFGFWGEGVTLKALKRVRAATDKSIYREHVTNYIYEREDLFDIKKILLPEIFLRNSNLRFTMDTENDYKIYEKLYKLMGYNVDYPENIIHIVKNDDKVLKKMQTEIKRNTK